MRRLLFIPILLFLCGQSFGAANFINVVVGPAAAAGGGYTTLADQTTNNSGIPLGTYRAGVDFVIPTSFTYIRATWYITSGTGTCEMRFDNDTNMTSEYTASTTFTPASGSNTVELSVGPTSSGTYYLTVSCPGGTIYRSDTEQTSSLGYRYVDYVTNLGSWEITTTGLRDWVLKLEYK